MAINKNLIDNKQSTLTPLNLSEFKNKLSQDVIILDTRKVTSFIDTFIPGSIFISLDNRFIDIANIIIPKDKVLLFISEIGKEEKVINLLLANGFNNLAGYLHGGIKTWVDAGENIDMIINIDADEFAMDIPFDTNMVIIDARENSEYILEHIKDAQNITLYELTDIATIANYEETQNIYIYSNDNYRSVIAASIFKHLGVHNVRTIVGGWLKIKEQTKIKFIKNISKLN